MRRNTIDCTKTGLLVEGGAMIFDSTSSFSGTKVAVGQEFSSGGSLALVKGNTFGNYQLNFLDHKGLWLLPRGKSNELRLGS